MALSDNLDGEWFMEGDRNRPCAIYQRGRVLLVVNEHGALGTGQTIGPTTIEIIQGAGWLSGLRGEVQDNGRTLDWRNGTIWRRM
jgi:hypothetical protein